MNVVITFQSKVLTKAVTKETKVSELMEFAASGLQLEGADLTLNWQSGKNGEQMSLFSTKTLDQCGIRNGDTLAVESPLMRDGTVLKLKVILGSRHELQVVVTDDLTVSELVKYLCSKTELSEKSLSLKYGMVFLTPHKKLGGYGINSQDTLELIDKEITLKVLYQRRTVTISGHYMDKLDNIFKKVATAYGVDWTEINLKYQDKYLLGFSKTVVDCDLTDKDTLINEDFLLKFQEVGGKRKFEKKMWINLYIYCIKTKIRTQFGLNNYKVTLLYNGIELDGNSSPIDYGIKSDETIEMKFQELKKYYLNVSIVDRNFKIDLDPSTSVVEFKRKIMLKATITTGNIQLIAEAKTMEDSMNIIDYDLDSGSTIQLIISLPGAL